MPLVLLPSPNNPTGNIEKTLNTSLYTLTGRSPGNAMNEEDVRKLCLEHCVVVIDEAYFEFSGDSP